MSNRPVCLFFLKGKCKFGDKCMNYHPRDIPAADVPMNSEDTTIPQINNKKSSSTCHFFLSNKCNKGKDCPFFHGYCDRLEYLKSIENHQSNIINLVNMDNTKYVSSDEESFHIRFSGKDEDYGKSISKDYKIGKLIYSSNKVICAIKTGSM